MKKHRWPWLVAALALIGVAAWLMSLEDEAPRERAKATVKLPRKMRAEEKRRAEERRTLPAPAPAPSDSNDSNDDPQPARPRDPVMAALPTEFKRAAVVLEANALRHSELGPLLVDCISSGEPGRALKRFQSAGMDLVNDLDRVAVSDNLLIASGHFQGAREAELFPIPGVPHGQKGMIYVPTRPDGTAAEGVFAATWGGQMLMFGPTEDELRAAIDRLEGRGLGGAPAIDETQMYGEIYGVIKPAELVKLLPEEQRSLAARLEAAAERVELHVDASRDIGIVADVRGLDTAETVDLGKSFGSALSLGRLQAQTDGKEKLAGLLESARVVPGDGEFRLEMGLPFELMEEALKACVARNEARREKGRKANAGSEPGAAEADSAPGEGAAARQGE